MPVNLPNDPTHAAGDLARSVTHEVDDSWPTLIEVVAYFGPVGQPRKGRRRAIEISADRYYGRGSYGAPITGDQILHMVDTLRKGS